MKRVFLLPSLFLFLIGALAFYARSGDTQRDIVFANAADILSRDVTQMTWAQDIRMAMGLYEGLLIYNPPGINDPDVRKHFLPGVAESWESTDAGQTWTFHLRKDAKWSNGDKVVAGDFLFSWKRALTVASGCQYAGLYYNIKGAQAYFEAQDATRHLPPVAWDTVGVRAMDDYTIEVKLSGPCSYFLDLMAFPTFFPLNQKAMEPYKTGDDYDPKFTLPPSKGMPGLVSNGPFMLTKYYEGDYHLLERNPYYWDKAHVLADRIKVVTRTAAAAALIELRNGSIDVLASVPSSFAPELLQEEAAGKRDDVFMQPVFGTYYYLFNCKRAPLDDARVRMALSLVVDKQLIVDKIRRLGETPINSITPPHSIAGYDSPAGPARNPERARELLAEAGFPGGKGMRPIEILFNNEADVHKQIAQAVGQMWQQELHIPVTFKGVDTKTFRGLRQQDHDFDVCRAGWYGDYPDPVTWLNLMRTGDGNNDEQYANPKYDGLLDAAAREFDIPKRFKLLEQAETLLTDQEAPFLSLYQYKDGYMYDPKKIAGMDLNVRTLTQFKFLHRVEGKQP